MEDVYDATIAVVADEALRGERAAARGHAARRRARRAASSRRTKKRKERTSRSATTGHSRRVEAGTVPRSCETRRDRPMSSQAARIARRRSRARTSGAGGSASSRWRLRSAAAGGRDRRRRWARSATRSARSRCPLRHDDIIRQQAADKELDPALIAAVIYEESRFRDQTSHAGRARPDADHARDGRLHRPALGRRPLQAGRSRHAADQHRLRRLVPALPDRPLRRQRGRRRSPPTTPASRTSTGGSARPAALDEFEIDAHAVPGDARVRGERARAPRASTASTTPTISASERP